MIEEKLFNDLTLQWDIEFDDPEETLEGKDVEIYITNRRMHLPMDFVFNDDYKGVTFTYLGKDQTRDGIYSLEMWIDKDQAGQRCIVCRDAFALTMC